MRTVTVSLLLLTLLLPPPAAAQGGLATIEPTLFFWDDYSRSFAQFTVRVTNGGAADAYTITEIDVEPSIDQPIGAVYSPTPTLPLAAGAQGAFQVWVGGFDQPSPPGPAAGDYTVRVKVQSTTDAERQQTLTATIRRTQPEDPGTGIVTGSVRDSRTGAAPQAFGPTEVTAHDPASVRVLPDERIRKALDPMGGFRFELPPGNYWLRAEASGYQTAYVGPINVTAGGETSADISMSPNAYGRFEPQTPRTVNVGLPTYRLAGTVDLSSVVTAPGFYTRQGGAAEAATLISADGQARWSRSLGTPSQVPFDNPHWTSTDHGVDVSADGDRVAIGTAAGTIEIFGADGKNVGQPYRGGSDVNPLVPGPLGMGLLRSSEVRFSHDGTRLAAGSLTGWVYLFDAINGTLLWKTPTAGQVRALRFSPQDDRLYAGSGDNRLYALDADTGSVAWTTPIGFWPWEHIGMSGDGGLLVTGGKDGVLRVFDRDGRLQWSRSLPGFILGFDIAPGGQQVFAMTGNGIHSYNREGQLRWFRGEIQNNGQLHVGSGGFYVGYGKTSTRADEPAMRVLQNDGTLVWEHKVAQPESVYNVFALDDGTRIVANGRSGNVYFFDHWTIPPTGSRGPTTGESPGGGSPAPGAVLVLVGLGWVAWRRRQG